jgi:hypothetical protein
MWRKKMKKLFMVLAIIFSVNANANCYTDSIGFMHCVPKAIQPQLPDFRTDRDSPQIYQNGRYRGNLNNNKFDPNSISNPYGRYGSPYSSESINNPFSIGGQYDIFR